MKLKIKLNVVSDSDIAFSHVPHLPHPFFSHPETDLLYASKVYRDDRMRKKAELMTMDNCKELDRLNNLFRGG